MKPIHVLHITAHLGGGVGKVLSRLVEESNKARDGILHTIVALEVLEKSQFADHLTAHGGKLIVCPSREELNRLVSSADIVQLEWWHHPIVAAWLCSGLLPEMRLIVWSHVSGLHPPLILPEFVRLPHRFIFTSPCSLEHPELAQKNATSQVKTSIVFSSGGFNDMPKNPRRLLRRPLRAGYIGTLNFSKLHPQLLDYLAAVTLPDFNLTMIGDPTTGAELLAEASMRNISTRLSVRGFSTSIVEDLAKMDVFVYLLNPLHYGTTENALLEAMAMGVLPIVLPNPAERHLVTNKETGLWVNNPKHFSETLNWLTENPQEYQRISKNAAADVRTRFSVSKTLTQLNQNYSTILLEKKRSFDFRPIFGHDPAEWFRSCQGEQIWRFQDIIKEPQTPSTPGPHYLYEKSKGSVFHYHKKFPSDSRLAAWSAILGAP